MINMWLFWCIWKGGEAVFWNCGTLFWNPIYVLLSVGGKKVKRYTLCFIKCLHFDHIYFFTGESIMPQAYWCRSQATVSGHCQTTSISSKTTAKEKHLFTKNNPTKNNSHYVMLPINSDPMHVNLNPKPQTFILWVLFILTICSSVFFANASGTDISSYEYTRGQMKEPLYLLHHPGNLIGWIRLERIDANDRCVLQETNNPLAYLTNEYTSNNYNINMVITFPT